MMSETVALLKYQIPVVDLPSHLPNRFLSHFLSHFPNRSSSHL